MRASLKFALLIIIFSSIFIFSAPLNASALSLNDNVVADASAPGLDCSYNLNPLTWLICPVVSGINAVVNGLDGEITSALTINPCTYFDATNAQDTSCKGTQTSAQSADSEGFYIAWTNLRNIALGLMVIGALIMIISQVIGLEVLDAYTIRKVLPRIIIAAIGISLSWQLMQFLIQLSNDLGHGVSYLIYQPFQHLTTTGGIQVSIATDATASSAVAILSFAAISNLSLIASLTFGIVALLAVGIGFIIIVLRQILVIFLALLSPIAIAMFILPSTAKVWKLWSNTFLKALIMFPLIAGIIAIGRVFAEISSMNGTIGQFIAFVAYFGPYFIIPQTFKFAGGILGAASGFAAKAQKGAGKSMAGYRAKKRKETSEERKLGNTRLSSGKTGGIYRRITTKGGLNPLNNSKFLANDQQRTNALAAEALKNDNGEMAGDNIATDLASQVGMTGGKFVKEYSKRLASDDNRSSVTPEDESKANLALAKMQTNFRTRMGSGVMQSAAAMAGIATSTRAYDTSEKDLGISGTQRLYDDAGSMVKRGLWSESFATSQIQANRKMLNQSGAAFGDTLKAVHSAASGNKTSAQQVKDLYRSAYQNSVPEDYAKANPKAIKALAPQMFEQLGQSLSEYKTSNTPENKKAFMRELAKAGGVFGVVSNAGSPESTKIISDGVMSQMIDTDYGQLTVRETYDRAIADTNNNEMKDAKALYAGPQSPSDIRLKENIVFVGIINGFRHYSFNYIHDKTTYVGVMAQEIIKLRPEAVIRQKNGYYAVDYAMLGLKMYTFEEWNLRVNKTNIKHATLV